MAGKRHLVGVSMARLTGRQQEVLRYMLERPTATLEEAARACRQDFTYIRKWMKDKEFTDYWGDLRRWRRTAARERLEHTITRTAHRLEAELDDAPPRQQLRMMELADELLRAADRLLDVEREERRAPVDMFGWSETVGFPGPDGLEPRMPPPADRPAAGGGSGSPDELDPDRPFTQAELEALMRRSAEEEKAYEEEEARRRAADPNCKSPPPQPDWSSQPDGPDGT